MCLLDRHGILWDLVRLVRLVELTNVFNDILYLFCMYI